MAATRRPQVRFWVRVPDPGTRANRKSGKWQSGASTPARFLALCWELRSCSERETGGTLVKLEIDLSRSLAPMTGGSFWAAAAGQGWQQHQAGRLDQLSRQKSSFFCRFTFVGGWPASWVWGPTRRRWSAGRCRGGSWSGGWRSRTFGPWFEPGRKQELLSSRNKLIKENLTG